MIAVWLTVPVACWRKAHARELVETEQLPPPATCYGALLSLVGETDRERHRGCRVTAGLLNTPGQSTVVRTFWQVKMKKYKGEPLRQGNGPNAGPDFQQLRLQSELVIWCDSALEVHPGERLEARVRQAFATPETVDRFGGWSLGESTHLINDAKLLEDGVPPGPCLAFLQGGAQHLSLPTWVDHVGAAGTRFAVGALETLTQAPDPARIPTIPPGG